MRILAIDVGEKRIGFAISDSSLSVALGLYTYERKGEKEDLEEIEKIVKEYGVFEIVVGIPKDMKGRISQKGKDIEVFAKKIEEKCKAPIVFWDERFTTNEAHRVMDLKGINHRKRKRYIDTIAAQIILQGYLDARIQRH
ncbi:MAG: Holliday junction resolvase RuvX [Desulfobacterota bacterium]|nr:Holliday junction resolvase RuvX [Thermodesulfobacteriota bacterium]MDW8002055.1 Holliday junction resolvase RuvX [Deltaproteobacteria bacterium]